ncbi:hypothetical protein [Lacinutrix chionoecetis]
MIKAQENNLNRETLKTFDKIIGLENTKLYNGKRYYNIYKSTEDNHNFFSSPNFLKGDVYYDGEAFLDVDLKYDVFNDQLIFQPEGEKGFINVELIQEKVANFQFQDHYFINTKNINENKELVSGYLEIIYTTSTLKLYAKRKKTVSERIRRNKLYYLFTKNPTYYLSYNGNLNEINSAKSFRKIFPELAKELKNEAKENKKRFRDNDEGLYKFLTQWLDFKISTNSTNK